MNNLSKKMAILVAAMALLTACGQKSNTADTANTANTTDQSEAAITGEVTLYRGYGKPHGAKSFSSVGVVMADDKIVAVSIDEYQTGNASFKAVPNSDKTFAEGLVEDKVLFSKLENSEAYSKNMTEKAASKVSLKDNYKAIEDFAVGKTIAELKEVADKAEAGKPVDAVTGATLVDTKGYLENIVEVVENPLTTATGEAQGEIVLKRSISAPHGEDSFAEVMVVEEDGKVIASSIDEFQFMPAEGVPNSDGEFADSYRDAQNPLASKLQNKELYSKLMTEYAKSTVSIDANYKAIEDFAAGKTKAEIEEVVNAAEDGKPVDAVTGATLVDTKGYLKSIADTL